jgi:pimeloyl-ACP methyl ester carboxylesterase
MTRIIYLHGFASSPASSKASYFRDYLENAGVRVDVPDLASGDFEHLTITGQLAVIEEVAGGEFVSLIGSSLGGYLAALYAARHPEVGRLVLLAPAFAFARLWGSSLGGAEQVETWRRTGTMEVFHYGENRSCRLGYQLLADAGRYEDYPDFSQPALIFHGLHDDAVPVSSSREFSAGHPNATLEVLDSDHQLLNMLDYMAPKTARFLIES